MRLLRTFLCVLWFTAGALAGTAPPNVVLVTIDTTRADRMGFLGSNRGLTPNLDALAKQSLVFTRAYSQVPLTAPSHATILTGTYPQFHQINNFGIQLAADLPYTPDILRAHGYHTAAFVGAIVLDPQMHMAPGFERGFDTYDAGFNQASPDRYRSSEKRAGVVVAHALDWLAKHPSGPFFLWVHLYDPHDPYDPPEPYKTKYKSEPYDGEIAYSDAAVGKLLTQLRMRGLYDNSMIAVMSDHGEALGDHGEDTHGVFLYDETIHVPLVIKLPAQRLAERIEGRVQLVDVLPTILDAAGIDIPKDLQGESLLAMRRKVGVANASPATHERPAYSETDYSNTSFGWSSLRSLRTGKYLFVSAPKQELYDEAVDLKAAQNQAAVSKAVADTLAGQLEAFRQKTSSSREAPKSKLDAEQQEKLAALGYFAQGSGTSSSTGSKAAAVDPKDKIEIVNALHRAELLESEQHFGQAVALLEQVKAKAPEISLTYRQLGQCYMMMQDYRNAIPVLRKAAELRPDWVKEHFQLGVALFETEDFEASVKEFQAAEALSPGPGPVHLFLANAYRGANRMPDAIAECEKILASDPNDYGANVLLGRVLVLTGKAADALARLNRAAEIEPKASEPHSFLADAYIALKRPADAARERALAKRLGADSEE
jgi:choline-sulfatase